MKQVRVLVEVTINPAPAAVQSSALLLAGTVKRFYFAQPTALCQQTGKTGSVCNLTIPFGVTNYLLKEWPVYPL